MQNKRTIPQHVDQGEVLQLELPNKPITLEHDCELRKRNCLVEDDELQNISLADSEIDEMITDYNLIAVQDDFDENKIPILYSYLCGSFGDYVCPHCKADQFPYAVKKGKLKLSLFQIYQMIF
ncbi:Hypothetical predicted protein [Octopus vulgaris]|uniref:Uncharacterized protein n=1 Tax=Octopus vulgaris TaxID=6645 RepID=A0AA36AL52_OCTVU|nr:Hypothetical predicted protein [Octopus vulgaris]